MKIETKYNVGDKVWLRCKDVESYIKEHPYEEPQKILESCFHEGHVNVVKVETSFLNNEPFVSYVISNTHTHLNNDPLSDIAYKNRLYYDEENVFSNFDEVTNMIKEIHKDVLNNLRNQAEKILEKYDKI
jgi:hypothetical protein